MGSRGTPGQVNAPPGHLLLPLVLSLPSSGFSLLPSPSTGPPRCHGRPPRHPSSLFAASTAAASLARAKTSPLLHLKASPSLLDFAGEQRCRPPFPVVPLLSLCFALPLSTPCFFFLAGVKPPSKTVSARSVVLESRAVASSASSGRTCLLCARASPDLRPSSSTAPSPSSRASCTPPARTRRGPPHTCTRTSAGGSPRRG